jgi:hypothetical protein
MGVLDHRMTSLCSGIHNGTILLWLDAASDSVCVVLSSEWHRASYLRGHYSTACRHFVFDRYLIYEEALRRLGVPASFARKWS